MCSNTKFGCYVNGMEFVHMHVVAVKSLNVGEYSVETLKHNITLTRSLKNVKSNTF